MVELNNKIQIFFVISSIILSVHALEISILDVLSDFKCKTKILVNTDPNGKKSYNGTALKSYYYETHLKKSKVIAYIVDETRFEEIASANALGVRTKIGQKLEKNQHELVVFGIKFCEDNELDLIGAFLYDFFKPHPNHPNHEVLTMGEENFGSATYWMIPSIRHPFGKYRERREIYNGALQEHLRISFPKMAYRTKRPGPRFIKEVRFLENLDHRRTYTNETRWPVVVENGEYKPSDYTSFDQMKNNFMKRHNEVISVHILIVGGKDYDWLTTESPYPVQRFEEMKKIMKNMRKNNEILFVMGCFNFDWSEIELVTQMILRHSIVTPENPYNVFTVGIGMFDTLYHNPNEYDRRKLQQSSNAELMAFVKKWFGGKMNRKTIEVFNLNSPTVTKYHIELQNGRYESTNFLLTNQFARYAFIVIDATEMYDDVFARRHPYVKELQSRGIGLFLIKLNNFELHDLHIIPEWIESNRNAVPPNRIAVLGGGSCNTRFQFLSPQYQVTYSLLNVANELKEIREAFRRNIVTADDKTIVWANINVPDFSIIHFPMHTINGFYDPVVLSGNDMISTVGNTRILFLIVQADKFVKMMHAIPRTVITDFRLNITDAYPLNQWTVYLVGLRNFCEKDFHLFAEFVKGFTNDQRPLRNFVWTFGDGIYQSMYGYRYRDTLPFSTAMSMPRVDAFTEFFKQLM